MKAAIVLVFLTLRMSLAGPNQNAILSLDLLPSSTVSDSTLSVSVDNGSIWLAVRIAQAVGLDSYGCEVGFDSSMLIFAEAIPSSPAQSLPNFLESRGGMPLGFIGKLSTRNATQVTIAHSLIGSDSAQSPSGAGIVALIRFQPKGKAGVAQFTLGKPQLLDWKLQPDTAIVLQTAKLTLTAVVAIKKSQRTNPPMPLYALFLGPGGERNVLGRSFVSRRIVSFSHSNY